MFDDFLSQHGRIDVLVNNAVSAVDTPFLDVTEADFDFQIGNGYRGYFMFAQRAAKEMVRQGDGGRIVSISSVQAFRSWPGQLVYGSIKAAVSRMTLGMAWELAGKGINCNAVAPGYIDNRLPDDGALEAAPRTIDELPRLAGFVGSARGGVPSDIASMAVVLCSELGDYVNGETIVVDGGLLAGGTPDSGVDRHGDAAGETR